MSRRRSGVLLHPTALPSPYSIGDFGPSAYEFVDLLVAAGQAVWQVLPLGPTGYGDSPYSSFSAFAGNTLLISPDKLVEVGDLSCDEVGVGAGRWDDAVDYGHAVGFKGEILSRAAARFLTTAGEERLRSFTAFCASAADWLDDYALYRALRGQFGDRHWREWPMPLRDRDPAALAEIRRELQVEIHRELYSQFVFFEQWSALKRYAGDHGIELFGDIPIFVADDSSDVWAHRELFQLDRDGVPVRVAGVPPDYFSATGQRWGNPLYHWQRLAARGFDWWIERLRRNLELYDLIRIDHFRGFCACWSIPVAETTAIRGVWEESPGDALFAAATTALGPLPVVAEDLGVITADVDALRERFGFPGMKILHFAFGSGPSNPYLPHNYPRECVVYTGTHDNDTTCGWWSELSSHDRGGVERYCGRTIERPARELMRLAAASVADLCIFPMQDILSLDSSARFNLPGAPAGNWGWRMNSAGLDKGAIDWLAQMTCLYGRDRSP